MHFFCSCLELIYQTFFKTGRRNCSNVFRPKMNSSFCLFISEQRNVEIFLNRIQQLLHYESRHLSVMTTAESREMRRGFKATLNFRKFKVALSPLCRIFLNFAKSCILSRWLQFDNKKWGSPSSFLSYKCLKLKLRIFLAGHTVLWQIIVPQNLQHLFTNDWAVC